MKFTFNLCAVKPHIFQDTKLHFFLQTIIIPLGLVCYFRKNKGDDRSVACSAITH